MNGKSRPTMASHDLASGQWADLSAHRDRIVAAHLDCARAGACPAPIEKTLGL
jgi:hypothetical protein